LISVGSEVRVFPGPPFLQFAALTSFACPEIRSRGLAPSFTGNRGLPEFVGEIFDKFIVFIVAANAATKEIYRDWSASFMKDRLLMRMKK
jgi:hypothetical protein